MGEVYRAKDTKLGREVAIKVLPEDLADNEERLLRFEREAQVLASLNHPNIATLYGFERDADTRFLVMELVEGEDLAARLLRGPIPLDELVPIFIQIAEGLEAAHNKGIIHRDLKPANIKLSDDGTAKVLDFGLAKAAIQEASYDTAAPESPTVTYASYLATRQGQILGTAAYMAPEQAKGKLVDQRADVWAFGVCLYEALTGRRAFQADDAADTIAAVLRADVDWDAPPPGTPRSIRRLLRRCVEREPRSRLHSMADARLELEGTLISPSGDLSVEAASARRAWPFLPMALALVTGVGLASLVFLAKNHSEVAESAVLRSVLSAAPSAAPVVPGFLGATDIAITPDGSNVVYLYNNEAGYHNLYLRPVNRLEGTRLTKDFGYYGPFISPDGEWLGYSHASALEKMPIEGGRATTICEPGTVHGASWGPDGSIVFALAGSEPGLYQVDASGGQPQLLLAVDEAAGESQFSFPEYLPRGDALVFTVKRDERTEIALLDLRSLEKRTLLSEGSRPRYATTGHLLFGVNGAVFGVPFDLDRLAVGNAKVPVLEGVISEDLTGGPNFAVSQTGRLVYVGGDSGSGTFSPRRLLWVDRRGRTEALSAPERGYAHPRISPDGQRLALEVHGNDLDLWIWDFDRETLSPLGTGGALDHSPMWSPDNRRILFVRDAGSAARILEVMADGSGSTRPLANEPVIGAYSLSRDEKWLVYQKMLRSDDLGVLSLDSREPRVLLQTDADERNGEISPDGHWLAYESNQSGNFEIWVVPFPDVDAGRWMISSGGGSRPLWSPDGSELFFYGTEGLMSVAVEGAGVNFRAERAKLLFQTVPVGLQADRDYDISRDGERFLMLERIDPGAADMKLDVILVENWFDELLRLVPID